MSFSYWWVFCSLKDERYQVLQPMYAQARATEKMVEEYGGAYELCKKTPLTALAKYIPFSKLPADKKEDERYKNGYIELGSSHQFAYACNILEYRYIFQNLPLNEQSVLRFIGHDGAPPVSILHYALGLDLAETLPGSFGNLLVHRDNIDHELKKIKQVLKNLDKQAWDRARRVFSPCSAGLPIRSEDSSIKNIFTALPECLAEAKKRSQHFASLATHQF